eukprot:7934456-Pyramimonas_sp.AAC.1
MAPYMASTLSSSSWVAWWYVCSAAPYSPSSACLARVLARSALSPRQSSCPNTEPLRRGSYRTRVYCTLPHAQPLAVRSVRFVNLSSGGGFKASGGGFKASG